jgi:hypothetical protein
LSAARQRFLEAAVRIGRRLCRDSVWRDGRCNWLGWAMEPHGGQWVSAYRAMGVTVYDGSGAMRRRAWVFFDDQIAEDPACDHPDF